MCLLYDEVIVDLLGGSMKRSPVQYACVWGLTSAVVWAVCALFVVFFPDASGIIFKSWIHRVNIELLGSWKMTIGNFLFGGVTLTASAGALGYVYGWLWKMVGKNK